MSSSEWTHSYLICAWPNTLSIWCCVHYIRHGRETWGRDWGFVVLSELLHAPDPCHFTFIVVEDMLHSLANPVLWASSCLIHEIDSICPLLFACPTGVSRDPDYQLKTDLNMANLILLHFTALAGSKNSSLSVQHSDFTWILAPLSSVMTLSQMSALLTRFLASHGCGLWIFYLLLHPAGVFFCTSGSISVLCLNWNQSFRYRMSIGRPWVP